MAKKRATKRVPFRMDFVILNPEEVDRARGLIRFQLVPDPRVWEHTTRNGEEGYFSSSGNTFVPISILKKMTKQLPGLPITYDPPPGFSGIKTYLRKSRERLGKDAQDKKEH